MGWHRSTGPGIVLALCLTGVVLTGLIHAEAGHPIYSYMDDRGNLVATDRWEDIPERYRSRVKTIEGISTQPHSSRSLPRLAWSEQTLFELIDRLPATIIPGLTTYQSVMLVAGFLGMLLFYGGARLTDSAFLRLLMPWAIGFLALATLYAMFVSDLSDKVAARSPDKSAGSLVHRFNEKGKSIGEQKKERLKRIDDLTGQQ
jgi:hypothetical protein